MNIKEVLIKAQKQFKKNKISSAGLDAEILLLKILNDKQKTINKERSFFEKIKINRTWIYAHPEYKLSKSQQKRFESFIQRRLRGEPIAYIVSRKEFFGLNFYIDKRVMIPRPETEIIVENIIKKINIFNNYHHFNILDVGTGSGCISIALAKNICNVKIYAIDISKKAIAVAKINAKKHKVSSRIKFLRGNLFEPIQKIKINKQEPTIIIANLPYLKIKDVKKNIGLTYEPTTALDGGKDGLKQIKRFIIQLKEINFNIFECWLEINPKQTVKLRRFIKENLDGVKIKIIKDLSKQDRFLKIIRN